jgi:hypothetical protein
MQGTTTADETEDDPSPVDRRRVQKYSRKEIATMPAARLLADLGRHPKLSLTRSGGSARYVEYTDTPPLALDYALGRPGWVIVGQGPNGESRVQIGSEDRR